jgi:hypothetical protein
MFDTYLVRGQPDVHVHNRIEQKPHDPADAARLYGQLKDRAEAEVSKATIERLGAENEIKVVFVESNICTDTVRVLFTINGVRFDFEIDRNRIALEFYSAVAQGIAAQLLKQFTNRLQVGKKGDV